MMREAAMPPAQAWVGMTDSDDIQSAQSAGVALSAGPALWRLRNTVAVIRDAPRPAAAEQLFQYLQSPGVQEVLLKFGALEPATVFLIEPRWGIMVRDFAAAGQELRGMFHP